MGKSSKAKSDRGRIIEWYKDDIDKYEEEIKFRKKLIKTLTERIEALKKKDEEEYGTEGRLPRKG